MRGSSFLLISYSLLHLFSLHSLQILTDVLTGPLQRTLGTSPDGVTYSSYSSTVISTTSPCYPTILDEETTNYVCNIVAKREKNKIKTKKVQDKKISEAN